MVVCDLHTDSVARVRQGIDLLKKTKGAVDLVKLTRGKVVLVVFACWVRPNYSKPFEMAIELIESIWQFAERSQGRLRVIRSMKEFNPNRINILIGVEGGHIFEKNLLIVDALLRIGVRIFTLTWNNSNTLAHSALDGDRKGLTRKGKRFVKEIADLGGLIDLSHASTKTVIDCCETISTPVIASHSCLRSINPIMRNISDSAIAAIFDSGGVVGINVSRYHLGKSSVKDHAQYLFDRFGPKVLAFGSDFDGIRDPIIPDCSKIPQLFEELVDSGMKRNVVESMASKNFLRVLRKCVH